MGAASPELVVEVAYEHMQSGRFRHMAHCADGARTRTSAAFAQPVIPQELEDLLHKDGSQPAAADLRYGLNVLRSLHHCRLNRQLVARTTSKDPHLFLLLATRDLLRPNTKVAYFQLHRHFLLCAPRSHLLKPFGSSWGLYG
jgi:hypothetical protein